MNAIASSSQPETRKHRVCPWWAAYFFDNPLRRLMHPAARILGPYVKEGMTALDLGCGFGHYSLGMARMTGKTGLPLTLDFALASNSLHEAPDPAGLLRELFAVLSPGALFLLMEPGVHLKQEEFEAEVVMARTAGFEEVDRPRIFRQRCSLLRKPASGISA